MLSGRPGILKSKRLSHMSFSAEQIAQFIQGRIEGDANVQVISFGKIEEAGNGQLTFLANPKYEEFLYTTQASLVIVNESLVLKQPVNATLIRVADAYAAFATLLEIYQQYTKQKLTGTDERAYIHPKSIIGKDVYIGGFVWIDENVTVGDNCEIHPGVYIGKNVKIGNNAILHPGVKIYFDSVIGSNVIIHAGTVVGSDGFGFAPLADGTYKKIPQMGNVIIEDNVEIGANSTIDRATLASTIIRKGAKIDNLVQIAHNVEVGENTVIAAQAGISGSTKIGKQVMIGGQAGLGGHIQITDGTKINGQSGVSKSIKKPMTLSGTPANEFSSFMRSQVALRNFPDMERRIKELEELVKKLISSNL